MSKRWSLEKKEVEYEMEEVVEWEIDEISSRSQPSPR